mmetsp:Transcript_13566/g.31655  ORF Transcript_13566/g.31655 Transcript_13566/m.31655 type:complete len:121 (+) Transcript_13566:88-450(+)|eukprot:CAMPEP_0119467838 /NCGR_PEP_ID=MMETSP1344-20130328/1848_1 /TAXON_ID=236787 /ORGANISM="Florenciella parvula, Strain CCMP2471" /LENGTH=120 /DNA_ID=CAMNT_0007500243 /DNA_START=184 /DNA_END=546 /DNA_ORIENTATION=-
MASASEIKSYRARLRATPRVRDETYYNVPRRTKLKGASDSAPRRIEGASAAPAAAEAEDARVMPTDFWTALRALLDQTNLSRAEVRAIEQHFRQAHAGTVGSLSLDTIEELCRADAGGSA